MPILVTGATGYIGGRLVPRLLERDRRVRVLVRDARKLEAKTWAKHPSVEILEGDAGSALDLDRAMRGCEAAYYLIHSMVSAGAEYRERDRMLAAAFGEAAARGSVERIVYLGGLGELGDGLSEHLASRREVEAALAASGVPVTTLRAAMIIGSGSASFEILRYLVERLPIMVTPKWVSTRSQPIAIRNTLEYLVRSLETPETKGRTLEIGGADVLRYSEILQLMAESLGLRRRVIIPVPVLTPRLSSLWIHWVTPLDQKIARPLAEGLRNPVVCSNDEAARLMPQRLLTVREAIDAALGKVHEGDAETMWSDAGPIPGDPDWSGGKTFVDRRRIRVRASPAAIFQSICRLGGPHGWHKGSWLWMIRGWIDRLAGGPGLGRGRRRRASVAYGDALDFWRVTRVVPDRTLSLRAEMKLPGEATLEFEIEWPGAGDSVNANAPTHREKEAGVTLVQTARFKPRGLGGLLYWYAILPFHGFVFANMLRGIRAAAEEGAELSTSGGGT